MNFFGSLYSCSLWHFPRLDFIALVPTHSSVCFVSAKSVLLCPESRQTKCLISRTLPSPKGDPVNFTHETYSVVGAYKKERSGGGGAGWCAPSKMVFPVLPVFTFSAIVSLRFCLRALASVVSYVWNLFSQASLLFFMTCLP